MFGITGLWNLLWVIPLVVLIGFGVSTIIPFGKRAPGEAHYPPYAFFDESQHGRTFGSDAEVPDDFGSGPHPDKPCGTSCWSPGNGHRAI